VGRRHLSENREVVRALQVFSSHLHSSCVHHGRDWDIAPFKGWQSTVYLCSLGAYHLSCGLVNCTGH